MYLFMDTETGGLTPQHSLLTVSCIAVDENFGIIPRRNQEHGLYLTIKHDEYRLTAGALSVNKIDLAAHNAAAMSLPLATTTLLGFLEEMLHITNKQRFVPAGHNVNFDVQFIRAYLLDAVQWDRYFTYPMLDTAVVARFLNATGKHPGGYSLGRLRDTYVPDAAGDLHNAETDNLTTIALAHKFASMVR